MLLTYQQVTQEGKMRDTTPNDSFVYIDLPNGGYVKYFKSRLFNSYRFEEVERDNGALARVLNQYNKLKG